MLLDKAFNYMLGSLFAADATRGQVRGVLAWRALASRAGAGASICGRAPVIGEFRMPDSADHRTWKQACAHIIGALRCWEDEAERLRLESAETARRAEMLRDRCRDIRAAHVRDQETCLDAAAACGDPRDAEMFLAEAAAHGEAASVAGARADTAEACREAAAGKVDAAMLWQAAANDAAGAGQNLVAAQDTVHQPVVTAVADAGPENVAGDKYHYAMEG